MMASNLPLHDARPFRIWSQTVEIEATSDFADITYISTYAHFQWQGDVMVADNGSTWAKAGETKHYNGEKLSYNTEMHPLATSHWDEAMWKSHAEEIVAMVDTERRRLSR